MVKALRFRFAVRARARFDPLLAYPRRADRPNFVVVGFTVCNALVCRRSCREKACD